jgi:hypothetical protein
MDRKIALVKALSKVIWIQNDLFAKWYVRDGDEFVDEKLVPEIEPEGYLHGKKILHDGSESESEIEDAASTAGTCPFKGLAMTMGTSPQRPSTGSRTSSSDDEPRSKIGDSGDVDAPRRDSRAVPVTPVRQTFVQPSAIPRPSP